MKEPILFKNGRIIPRMRVTLPKYIQHPHLKFVLPFAWIGITVSSLIFTIALLVLTVIEPDYMQDLKYSLYSAKPLVLGDSTTAIDYKDSRADAIDRVMTRYNCPMAGLGPVFVKYADENNIPYWIVASIAFQESSCGKNLPKKDGKETFNAYGWGVWGENIKAFDDWEHGISVMSKYMNDMFYSQGVTDLCEIMKTYTPPSQGSWCEGVGYFRDQIVEYRSPDVD